GFEMHLNLLCIELRHLYGLRNEAIQPIALLVNDRQELMTLFVVHITLEQCGRRAFDGSKRRPQFMSDGVENKGAKALALPCGFIACDALHSLRPVDRNRNQASDRVCRYGRKNCATQNEQAFGTYARVDRHLQLVSIFRDTAY